MHGFIRNFTVFVLIFTALFSGSVLEIRAQDRVALEKNIQFRRGASSATVSGRVARGTTHWYHVRARAGQEMAVVLKTGNRTAFTISARHAGILEGADGVRRTLVELPETGDYLIEIAADVTANYTLEVTIH